MMSKKVFCVILSVCFLGSLSLWGQGFVLKKDIRVEEDEVQDNVISLGGDVFIKGEVTENVIAFGGTIIIEGKVGDTVIGFGSAITLRPTAKVGGDVVTLGGTFDRETGATVNGDTIYFSTSEEFSEFLRSGFVGIFGLSLLPLILIIKLITLFIWFILAVILAAVFPQQIVFASSQIKKSFWPVCGVGFLSIIIFTGLVIFSVLLSFILIGIPILLALIAVGIVIKIFGRVVIFYFLGESLYKAFGGKQPSSLLAVMLGLLVFGLIGFIPVIGSLFSFVLSIVGWGVVIRTKFGNQENWFARK
jgi:hypothetical protein